ncbi:sulfotransferase [Sphingomonas sp. BT-65]|uniref:tetratricopeptide repeat-containing sulfotransferase family protein n=1 Tax=Sphingomonas sp. BT-65 TaxID=2989821 RepID=UPI002236BE0F|nr:tetratricopeptide repeat-containing sulfotransferase family protein [Sphingomonas sp. BT-65]MCW4461712.1 sulfotransferase [Sphingomonas sp. BT-65]
MKTIAEQMNAAMAAFTRGDYPAARALGEGALRAQQNNAAILQFLGVASSQAGDLKSGAAYFRRAIASGGDTADNRINLAKTLMALGQIDEAMALCDGPVAANSPDLQRMKADILRTQGRGPEALWLYEALTVERPDDFEAWNNLGNARFELGDMNGALSALQRARELNSQSSEVHVNIARVLAAAERHEEACVTMERAALLAPKDPAPLLELGRMLTAIDHPTRALMALGAAAKLDSRDPRIFTAMGLAFSDLSDPQKAEQAFRFALRAGPASAASYLDLGILLEKANRVEELDALIAQAERAGATGPELDYLRALSANRRGETEKALELVRLTQSRAIHPAAVAQFRGQLADRLGLIDEAFLAFQEMNRIMGETPLAAGADRGAYRRGIDGLAEQTNAEWLARWKQGPEPGDRPSPVFLVGFPRSGTTLLDTLLMGHSGTHVLEEVPILEKIAEEVGPFERIAELDAAAIRDLRALYFAEVDKASPPPTRDTLIIDKNPLSMIRLPLIHRLFPDAKIILALRHPCDVVLSCYMQNFKPTEAMSSFLDLDNASRTYDRIFAYWEQCRALLPVEVQEIRYEDMVADAEAALRPVIAFLGLPWEGELLDHQRTATARGYIRTPSYAQVTEKVYRRASGRWERYADKMWWTLPVLEPWVRRFGYELPATAESAGTA